MRAAVLPTGLILLMGCATPAPAPKPPADPIQVRIDSVPEAATVTLGGKPLGVAPQDVVVDGAEALLTLDARRPDGIPAVEKRIRFLSMDRVEVSFRFGAERSAMAKVLGLPRILVFDYGQGVTFDTNKADLKPAFLPLLARQSALLKSHFSGVDVYVCGHTDSAGARDHNLMLSLQRAQSVADHLAGQGLPKGRLKIQGFGPQYPVADNDRDEGRALNRRTEVILPQ